LIVIEDIALISEDIFMTETQSNPHISWVGGIYLEMECFEGVSG
jgi:hypothetical protein